MPLRRPGWIRRYAANRARRAYDKLALSPDSLPAFAQFVAWALLAALVDADIWEAD
jgi:hypothetical protein